MKVLVTGGCGFIGSHTIVALHEAGHRAVIVDNLSNSSPRVVDRLEELTGSSIPLERFDVRDYDAMHAVISRHHVDAVIHFAALKAVGESSERPLEYYDTNVAGTISLLRAMVATGCQRLVFSSSCTVYGVPESNPVTEAARLAPVNPYGRTKLAGEQVIGDVRAAHPELEAAVLRYFNPVGAHPSGRIGEDPAGVPDNLMPFICQVAVGARDHLSIFGGDYPTPDGTGIRDYVHVMDVAEAHVAALDYMHASGGGMTANIGTGRGYSVLELVSAFERASGRRIPYEITARRPGDIAAAYADASLASELMGWSAARDLDAMCRDAWRWQSTNPNGYADAE